MTSYQSFEEQIKATNAQLQAQRDEWDRRVSCTTYTYLEGSQRADSIGKLWDKLHDLQAQQMANEGFYQS